ncbi:MAG: DUF3014 domain-containing protein [Pseudomonadota bacterium]
MRIGYLIAALVLGVLAIVLLQYRDVLFSGWGLFSDPPPVIEPVVTVIEPEPAAPAIELPPAPTPVPETVAPAPDPLPALGDSDDWLREQLGPLAWPESWLEADQLLRRGATVLSALAQGAVPLQQLSALVPEAPYAATVANPGAPANNQLYYPDPAGYARYAPLLDALLVLPPDALAGIFVRIEPLLDQAVAELGDRRRARDLINASLTALTATPELDSPPLLERPGVAYRYADASLEQLPALQKQFLRLGPDNLERLRSYAADFAAALAGEG